MIFIKAVIFLSLLHIAYLQTDKQDLDEEDTRAAGTTSSGCEHMEPATTYWTEWYSSSSETIHQYKWPEDFNHLCSDVLETQCREKYTHDTRYHCQGGVLFCPLQHSCTDVEIRLLCSYTNDTLPEPDLHWSLSERDSGSTRGAAESWNCNDEVIMVKPAVGSRIGGEVKQGESLSQTYGPQSHENLCGVQTNGNANLVFRPYVQNCLTSPDCCNSDHGISVMFWLRKNETNGNHNRPQSSPLHVFRSPSLVATVQRGLLIVTYLHVSTEWKVNTTLTEKQWTHVTITFYEPNNLTVYLNGEAKGVAEASTTSLSFHDIIEEYEGDNISFQVFSTEPGVTSPDIRPIAMTDLKIFFRTLSANLVNRTFAGARQDAPPKIMRMAVSQKTFLSSITNEPLRHIKLTCLIRSHDEIAQDHIHFLYKTKGGSFEEMTSDDFYMMTSLEENNEYRKTAVAQIYGRRRSDLQEFFQTTSFTVFTCDVTTDNQLSVYGYETVESHGSTNLDDTRYYNWTRFYDFDPHFGENEEETLTNHLDVAENEGYELPCQNPTYAECRTKSDSSPDEAKQWYEVSPPFVPDFGYWCEGEGIRCTNEGQECPDLEVRYACPFPNATMLNGTEDYVSSTSMPNNGTRSRNESEKTDTGSFVTSESGVIQGRVTDAPDTSSTSSSTPVHDWTPSSEGDTDSVTRKNPSGHHVTNDQDVNDRTPSSVSTSAASSPDTSATRHAPDTSTSTGTALPGDISTPDVSSTSRPTHARSTPGETKAHVGAKGTSETTVVNTRRTDYGGSTVSDTVVTSADTSRTTKPTVARPSNGDGGSSKATGNKKITITGNDSAHLNYLYPVMIVALGVGIPTLTACYYLCRKLTPEEIEERRLIEERKRKLEEQEKQTKPL